MHVLRVDGPAAVDRCRERDERRTEDDVDVVRRVERVEEGSRLARSLEHLPVAGDQHAARILRDRGHAGKLLALEQLERGAAAGRDPGDLVVEPELVERTDGVAAADDGVAVDRRNGLGDRLRPGRERLPLEHAHRPVPEDRPRGADPPREVLPRVWPDVEPEPAVRERVEPTPPGLSVLGELARRDDVGREHDLERERVGVTQLLRHLPADQHLVGPPAEVLEDAELVRDLGAAGDEHERALDLAEQPPEMLQLGEQEQPSVRGQQLRDADGRGVRPVRGAEGVVDEEVAALGELDVRTRDRSSSHRDGSACSRAPRSARPAGARAAAHAPARSGTPESSPFGRPRCEQTRTLGRPSLEQQLEGRQTPHGCACRRRPGRPRAGRSGLLARGRTCRRRPRREPSAAASFLAW